MASENAHLWFQQHLEPGDTMRAVPKGADDQAQILLDRATPNMSAPDETYGPVRTSNPSNPRVSAMSYYKLAQVVTVYWGDGGAPYNYYNITPALWSRWKKSASPGRFINRVLSGICPYGLASM
jgi:hypothetical protein